LAPVAVAVAVVHSNCFCSCQNKEKKLSKQIEIKEIHKATVKQARLWETLYLGESADSGEKQKHTAL